MSEPDFSSCKVCVFDAYGTLFDPISATDGFSVQLGEQAKPLAELWRAKQLEYTWLRSLMNDYADFWRVTGDALDFAMASHGITDPRLRSQLMDVYMTLHAFSEVKQTLEDLRRRGYQTAILSNGSPEMLVAATKSAGIYGLFDHLLNVDTVGVFKPDARVYGLATQTFGVSADQISFQSSNGWDIAGASHFGFKTIWINRYKKQPETLPKGPMAQVSSLDQILPFLPGAAD